MNTRPQRTGRFPVISPEARDVDSQLANWQRVYTGGLADQRALAGGQGIYTVQVVSPLVVTDQGIAIDLSALSVLAGAGGSDRTNNPVLLLPSYANVHAAAAQTDTWDRNAQVYAAAGLTIEVGVKRIANNGADALDVFYRTEVRDSAGKLLTVDVEKKDTITVPAGAAGANGANGADGAPGDPGADGLGFAALQEYNYHITETGSAGSTYIVPTAVIAADARGSTITWFVAIGSSATDVIETPNVHQEGLFQFNDGDPTAFSINDTDGHCTVGLFIDPTDHAVYLQFESDGTASEHWFRVMVAVMGKYSASQTNVSLPVP